MISVVLNWLYMTATCYIIGFGCIRMISNLLSGKERFRCKSGIDYLYAGIGAVTVYSQFYSVFDGVGLGANIGMLLICVLCILIYRKELTEEIHTFRLTLTPKRAAVAVILFLLMAYGTSFGIIHYDTGLYHAQSIRWIEEYGVVPGLGNLHSRLAYNSAAFCLSALYSMAFLGGQSYHCCAGYLAWLLAMVCAEAFRKERLKKPHLSDLSRMMGIYYLLIIFDEMVSPASDYFMVLLVFYIVIRWLELLEVKEKAYLPYGLLCLLSITVLTIKLSGALLLLLTIKPAVVMLKEKRIKDIIVFLLAGIGMVLPFLIRNVILSGWLVYPFTFMDLFDFDFKIPKGMADYDSREIQVWGRGYHDVTRYEEPLASWLPDWVRSLDMVNKGFLALALSGLLVLLFLVIYAVIKKRKDMAGDLHIMAVMAACFLFWLCSAPLIRYGCVFLWLTPVLTWGYIYLQIAPHTDRFRVYLIVLLLLGAYKAVAFGMELADSATTEYLVFQKDYDRFENIAYDMKGYTFYYPAQGDQSGYHDFPASPLPKGDILRGETIEEGFWVKE